LPGTAVLTAAPALPSTAAASVPDEVTCCGSPPTVPPAGGTWTCCSP
jgi:hypothetical protein